MQRKSCAPSSLLCRTCVRVRWRSGCRRQPAGGTVGPSRGQHPVRSLRPGLPGQPLQLGRGHAGRVVPGLRLLRGPSAPLRAGRSRRPDVRPSGSRPRRVLRPWADVCSGRFGNRRHRRPTQGLPAVLPRRREISGGLPLLWPDWLGRRFGHGARCGLRVAGCGEEDDRSGVALSGFRHGLYGPVAGTLRALRHSSGRGHRTLFGISFGGQRRRLGGHHAGGDVGAERGISRHHGRTRAGYPACAGGPASRRARRHSAAARRLGIQIGGLRTQLGHQGIPPSGQRGDRGHPSRRGAEGCAAHGDDLRGHLRYRRRPATGRPPAWTVWRPTGRRCAPCTRSLATRCSCSTAG